MLKGTQKRNIIRSFDKWFGPDFDHDEPLKQKYAANQNRIPLIELLTFPKIQSMIAKTEKLTDPSEPITQQKQLHYLRQILDLIPFCRFIELNQDQDAIIRTSSKVPLPLPERFEQRVTSDPNAIKKGQWALTKSRYDNILLFDHIGVPIARISRKKADWYVKNNLATEYLLTQNDDQSNRQFVLEQLPCLVDPHITVESLQKLKQFKSHRGELLPHQRTLIQLRIIPRGYATRVPTTTEEREELERKAREAHQAKPDSFSRLVSTDDPQAMTFFLPPLAVRNYPMGRKQDKCVVCGWEDPRDEGENTATGHEHPDGEEGLTRHHVLPAVYIRWLPVSFKEHISHDLLLLCHTCHEKYEKIADKLKEDIAFEMNEEKLRQKEGRSTGQELPDFMQPKHTEKSWRVPGGSEGEIARKVWKALSALLAVKKGKTIPAERIKELLKIVRDWMDYNGKPWKEETSPTEPTIPSEKKEDGTSAETVEDDTSLDFTLPAELVQASTSINSFLSYFGLKEVGEDVVEWLMDKDRQFQAEQGSDEKEDVSNDDADEGPAPAPVSSNGRGTAVGFTKHNSVLAEHIVPLPSVFLFERVELVNCPPADVSSLPSSSTQPIASPLFRINSLEDLDALCTLHWHVDFDIKKYPNLLAFILRWRQNFVDSMNPQFLPPEWSINDGI
ncbi:hypothetical protein BLNAU_18734 [Blattamonas nauphoetae]|uniref:HNH domain-containing protein n=1 Tax=Blattamonas nauphoetae TaxID=2049346 RepID=A0ABQ9X3L4_9EUKA|nr:hypothetical protein BLNAU_18734 [Blattamonas nauphoetae]